MYVFFTSLGTEDFPRSRFSYPPKMWVDCISKTSQNHVFFLSTLTHTRPHTDSLCVCLPLSWVEEKEEKEEKFI
jgi:hypothetical protein